MIYKVLYQEIAGEVPVRERTQALYMEANSEADVRKKLAERKLNIEFIQGLEEEHLAYEQNHNEDFKLEKE